MTRPIRPGERHDFDLMSKLKVNFFWVKANKMHLDEKTTMTNLCTILVGSKITIQERFRTTSSILIFYGSYKLNRSPKVTSACTSGDRAGNRLTLAFFVLI